MIETVIMTDRQPISWVKKLNPIWWLKSGDSWTAPDINNGEVYLPGVESQWLRNFYWFWRNPCGNFVGYVIGVEDRNYTVYGPAPVLATTPADEVPVRKGWKWSIIKLGWLRLPFIAYYGWCEFYLGWRPASGGFGLKIVNSTPGEN